MPATPNSDGERVLREAHTVKDMAERVLCNGTEANYATEKLRRAHAATVRALIRDLRVDPQQLIDVIQKESSKAIRRHEPRYRWGSCPRCGAGAWIVMPDADRAICSRGRDGALWDLVEDMYRWDCWYAEKFGEQHALGSFDDRGRPGAI